MKASYKDSKIDNFIFSMMGRDRTATIAAGECVTCDAKGNNAKSFSDDLSRKEYQISGMCQKCQDDFYGGGDDDE